MGAEAIDRNVVLVMYKVCLTNDDGSRSIGLRKLVDALSRKVDLTVIVPDRQRSGTGKALTLDKPLRIIEDSHLEETRFISHDGFPADSIIFAKFFMKNIDLVVSGINSGANVGYHRMMTSGTVGAVLEAAFQGYPAIALSQAVEPQYWFQQEGSDVGLEQICDISVDFIMKVLDKGLPPEIEALNINFPKYVKDNTELIVVKPSMIQVDNILEKKVDPQGSMYFSMNGDDKRPATSGDSFELDTNKKITISPIVLKGVTDVHLKKLDNFF